MKQCNKCLQDLDDSAFGRHSGANFLRPECKKCTNRLNKERRELKKKYGEQTEEERKIALELLGAKEMK